MPLLTRAGSAHATRICFDTHGEGDDLLRLDLCGSALAQAQGDDDEEEFDDETEPGPDDKDFVDDDEDYDHEDEDADGLDEILDEEEDD